MCEPVLITLTDASHNVITVIMSPWQVYANSLTTSGYCDPLGYCDDLQKGRLRAKGCFDKAGSLLFHDHLPT